jgi:hypothetical protein
MVNKLYTLSAIFILWIIVSTSIISAVLCRSSSGYYDDCYKTYPSSYSRGYNYPSSGYGIVNSPSYGSYGGYYSNYQSSYVYDYHPSTSYSFSYENSFNSYSDTDYNSYTNSNNIYRGVGSFPYYMMGYYNYNNGYGNSYSCESPYYYGGDGYYYC